MAVTSTSTLIRTPDQRLRVFVSSTLQELAAERQAAKEAITSLRLAPVMFELGARPHPPRDLYRAYLEQSHIFVGIYWQRYGWVAPGESISGLEDEYRLSGKRPKLIYLKSPAPEREERLSTLLDSIRDDDQASYRSFTSPEELRELIENDLALLLTERFEPAGLTAPQARSRELPVPLTPLLGRQEELAAVTALLLGDGVRLVTLTGPGGTGKTRLALQVAAELQRDFSDGAAFVPLAAVSDPELVVSTLAQSLGLTESGQPPLMSTLVDYLHDKELLLVLDNFEQVVAAAPVVAELLSACSKLKVLLTSRESLRLRGEHVFAVLPLALPQGATPAEALAQYAAIELFVQRAQAVNPQFALSPDNAPAVAQICVRLDGLPLAIELAAARSRILPPQAMLARLKTSFDVLAGGPRDLPARQRTLKNAIRWSYDLLNEAEKRLFCRLAVFVGAQPLAAIEAVCSADGDIDIMTELSSLLDKSLLRQEADGAGEPTFLMLRTMHDFARERLQESGELEALQRAHAAYFLALSVEAEPQLRGAAQIEWLGRLERQHGDLRAALAWAQAHDEDTGVTMAAALWRFWLSRGYFAEGRDWLGRMAALSEAPTVSRAKAIYGAGVLAQLQGDEAEADARFKTSLGMSRALGDKRGAANALNSLGVMAYDQGDYPAARALHEESLALRRELGDKRGLVDSLINLGNIHSDQGDYAAARAHYQEALALSRALGDKGSMVNALLNLGALAQDEERYPEAQAHLSESLSISRERGDKRDVAHALSGLGNVLLEQGDYVAARLHYAESLDIRREQSDERGIAHLLLHLGIIAHQEGDLAAARAHYQGSLVKLTGLGDKWRTAYLLEAFASLSVLEGQAERAARLFGAAEALRERIAAPVPPPERRKHEGNVAKVRAALEASVFKRAWMEGRSMSLEEATTEALAA